MRTASHGTDVNELLQDARQTQIPDATTAVSPNRAPSSLGDTASLASFDHQAIPPREHIHTFFNRRQQARGMLLRESISPPRRFHPASPSEEIVTATLANCVHGDGISPPSGYHPAMPSKEIVAAILANRAQVHSSPRPSILWRRCITLQFWTLGIPTVEFAHASLNQIEVNASAGPSFFGDLT